MPRQVRQDRGARRGGDLLRKVGDTGLDDRDRRVYTLQFSALKSKRTVEPHAVGLKAHHLRACARHPFEIRARCLERRYRSIVLGDRRAKRRQAVTQRLDHRRGGGQGRGLLLLSGSRRHERGRVRIGHRRFGGIPDWNVG